MDGTKGEIFDDSEAVCIRYTDMLCTLYVMYTGQLAQVVAKEFLLLYAGHGRTCVLWFLKFVFGDVDRVKNKDFIHHKLVVLWLKGLYSNEVITLGVL